MNKIYFLIVSFIVLASSCSTFKRTSYFQDVDQQLSSQVLAQSEEYSMTIRTNDELSIVVSSVDPLAAASFNLTIAVAQNGDKDKQAISGTPSLQTYIVETNGTINFPTLGKIKVAGLTKAELSADLETRLKEYIKDPIVNIQIQNFRIAVLGEVTAPGDYNFKTQRVTILDALASAKDMTPYGRRDNVLLVREENGKKELIRFDLTKSDLFASEYFYMQQNDVLYVEPNEQKQKDANVGMQKQYNLSVTTSIISYVISSASLIVALLVR